jgi:predicted transcriptional regulator of viral defense system
VILLVEGLSKKEMKVISFLELEEKRFFTKKDVRKFFKSKNDLNVYIHKLKVKKRIVKINKDKYYLIPIQAVHGWSEHPFIIADEVFNGENYFIGGKTALNYWHLIDQIPAIIEVYSTKKQGTKKILGSKFKFKRIRKMIKPVKKTIKKHSFLIASKKESKKWI